ncbi:hypothetical protein [Terribacillus saccharophilus]|uniref:hypothetical protein n=1 Tax=Terribacillus saccharophilus TaxID=361277 RepID=UPI00114078B4|nr:hypothetical protein [Terribacillus saccharophilus]
MEYSSDLKKEYEGYMKVKQNIAEMKGEFGAIKGHFNKIRENLDHMDEKLNHIYSLAEKCLEQEMEADKKNKQVS